MRRWTLMTLVVLFVLLVGAAIWQLALAGGETERFPGPVPGTPLPEAVATP